MDGSITTSVNPVCAEMDLVFVQVLPPSIVLKRPRSPPGAQSGPIAATYTTSGSRGSITMRPMCCVLGSIGLDQLFPPSIDLKTPMPHDELCMLFASPLPTHTTSPLDGAAATAPTEPTPIESETGAHVMPPLVVFQIPPVATATYIDMPRRPPRSTRGPSITAMSAMRPLIEAGPIERNASGRTRSESASGPWAATGIADSAPIDTIERARAAERANR